MKHILYLTNMNRQLSYTRKIEQSPAFAGKVQLQVFKIKDDAAFGEEWVHRLRKADAVILTHMGTGLDTPFMRRLAAWLWEHHHMYVLFADEKDQEKLHKGFSEEHMLELEKYIKFSGTANYINLVSYVAAQLGETISFDAPQPLPWQGIIGADGELYETYREYNAAYIHSDVGAVGMLFYREEWVSGELLYPEKMYQVLSELGLKPVIFFAQYKGDARTGQPSLRQSLQALFGSGPLPFDVLINTCKFSLLGLQAITPEDLYEYDIPILQAYNMFLDEPAWQASIQGLTAMEVSMSVALPEIDGAVHGGVIAAQTQQEDGSFVYLPVEERIRAVARRAARWAKLRHIPNQEKRIAIIFHNYPPSNSTIGSACGLDSPESVRRILAAMAAEGYTIDHVPEDSKSFMDEVLAHATNDRRFITDEEAAAAEGQLSAGQYGNFFGALSEKAQTHMTDSWGSPPGEVFNYNDSLLIPGFSNGNVWITVQPPRGFGEDPSKIYHDPVCAPTHHYEGFYYWLREQWKADAVLHIGTHGSLEWLPGKGTGLSPDCYPEMAIQELPNIYPYWTTIVGEGIQAKRRGAACLIGHLTPPMAHSGLYDAYAELEGLLDELAEFLQQKDQGQVSRVQALVISKAEECHLYGDIPGAAQLTAAELAGELHNRLTDLKHMQMRCGLHIFGQPPEGEEMHEFLSALVRVRNNDTPALPHLLAKGRGLDFQELQDNSAGYTADGFVKGKLGDRIWETVDDIIALLAEQYYQYDERWKRLPSVEFFMADAPEELWSQIEGVLHTVCEEYVLNLKLTAQEMTNTLHALDGGYIEPGPGGAPTGGRADVLPTGRNFYGVDERLLPTRAAYKTGSLLAEQVIEAFVADEERYPEQVGIVLWAGSNTRSHGQCAAQFLNLMGVRPIWQAGSSRVVGLEVIPLDELKRPRVDVTGRISGLIRDMMPNLIKWLDKAVLLVSELDEAPEDNYIKKHIDQDISWLMEEGESREDAYVKARWRIFGDPPGAYGAGIGYVLEAKNWESIDDLAEVYAAWGSYSYSTDRQVAHDERLFRRRLATMEVTVKNEDNRETSMLSSDDYNAYHGGMIAAVRSLSGKQPKSFVGDSSDSDHILTRTLQDEVKRLFRGEAANPKFIEGMMKHGYKGAADMAGYLAHSYQWDATSAVMEDWMYEEYARKYAFDEKVQSWMREVNPWALQRIAETLLEAQQRGLWHTTQQMKEELQKLYLSLEGTLEEQSEMKDAPLQA